MVYRRGKAFCVTRHNKVTQKMSWVGSFPTSAEAEAADHAASLGGRVDRYIDRWLSDDHGWFLSTAEQYARLIRPFRATFGEHLFAEIGLHEAAAWAHAQSKKNWEIARSMINCAIADGTFDGPNPMAQIRPTRLPLPSRLTATDLFALADCAIEVWGRYGAQVFAPLIICTAHLRLSTPQIYAAKKEDVHEDTMTVIGKNGVSRELTLSPEARVACRAALDANDSEWLFTNQHGGKLTSYTLFYYLNPVRILFGDNTLTYRDIGNFRPRTAPERNGVEMPPQQAERSTPPPSIGGE